jgi:hypothetical protein
MANTIKLKQGSGSDPSASDLVLGEPAIRTDTGEIFLKKDDGSIAKVAGGIDDGDKGDITVSNDGATFTIDSGVIDNANVASNAAIAGSKISPDFGSQNVATTGTLGVGNTTISSTAPFLTLNDTNTENDFSIQNADGTFRIRDIDAASNRMTLDSSGQFTFATNVDFSSGIDVTGDVTVTSTAPIISLVDTNANDDFEIKVNAGNFAINDATNSANRFLIDSSGTVDIAGNLDVGAGLDVTGEITATSHLDMPDNAKIKLGTGDDLEIFHNATNSVIADVGNGNLSLQTNGTDINFWNSTDGEYIARFIRNGAVELYHDGNKKFETSDYGSVTTGVHSVSNGILELKAAIATSHTITTDYNAIAVDPTINSGVTVTVPSGAVWAIV